MTKTESSQPMQEPPGAQGGTAMERIDRMQQMLKQAGPQQEAPAGYTKQAAEPFQSLQDHSSAAPDLDRLQQMLKQAGPQADAPEDYTRQASPSPSPLTTSPVLNHSPAYTALTQDPKRAAYASPFQGAKGLDVSSFDQRQPNSLGSIIDTLRQSGCSAGMTPENVSCGSSPRADNTSARTR